MYSRKQWVDMRFCEREIRADPNLRVVPVGTARRCSARAETVALRLRGGERIRSVRMTLDGRRSKRFRRAGRRSVRVSLRRLDRGQHRVVLRARTSRGRAVTATRTYRVCLSRADAERDRRLERQR